MFHKLGAQNSFAMTLHLTQGEGVKSTSTFIPILSTCNCTHLSGNISQDKFYFIILYNMTIYFLFGEVVGFFVCLFGWMVVWFWDSTQNFSENMTNSSLRNYSYSSWEKLTSLEIKSRLAAYKAKA